MVRFVVGDMAVYQGQGIGKITAVGTIEVANTILDVYTLEMDTGTIVRIPKHKAEAVGLRQVTPSEEIPGIFDLLREQGQRPKDKTWNRRYRAYNEKLRTGTVRDTAEVMRDLFFLRGHKELSFGERQMLEHARSLLVKEFAVAMSKTEPEIEEMIEGIFPAP